MRMAGEWGWIESMIPEKMRSGREAPRSDEDEIRFWTGHLRFDLHGGTHVDAHGWATVAERAGRCWPWTLQWIHAGWPSPPLWAWYMPIFREGAD